MTNEIDESRLTFQYKDDSKFNSLPVYSDIKKIYGKFADEYSKRLFLARLELSFTDDICVFSQVVNVLPEVKKLKYTINCSTGKKYIYGCGIRGAKIIKLFDDIKWDGCIDIKKQGKFYDLPIIDLEKICIEEDDVFLISLEQGCKSVRDTLINKGVSPQKILCLEDYNSSVAQNKYFDEEIIEKRAFDGTFIDCGCFNAEDTLTYIKLSANDENRSAICFEADEENASICVDLLAEYRNVLVVNAVVSDCNGTTSFMSLGNSQSYECNEGNSYIKTVKIDDYKTENKVSLIKMDIEGGEYKALLGARKTIQRDKPVLAISIYHKRWDVLEIPKLILEINPEYKFIMRHYSVVQTETVLYAY